MKRIQTSNLIELNDVIMELPAFRDLSSKEMIHEVLNLFTQDIYKDRPQELFDAFNSKLSKKMQATFFENYGIDSDYSGKLKGFVKSDIAYQLEKLFQNKGSNAVFKILATVMESIFPRMNFYNIEVHKSLSNNGETILSYKLNPLYIQDPDHLIKVPEISVDKTRKYIMELSNFSEYTVWPMPTNLIYIQFNVGLDLVNNLDTFLHGIRGYGTTYLSGLYFNYLSDSGVIEKLEGSDMELLVTFMSLNVMQEMNPDWTMKNYDGRSSKLSIFDSGSFQRLETETDLEFNTRIEILNRDKCDYLQNMAIMFMDYKKANYSDRKEMEPLRRRWQMFLRNMTTTDSCYDSLDDLNGLNQIVKERYPRFYEDFWMDVSITYHDFTTSKNVSPDNEGIFSFFIKIYSIFLAGANSSFNQPKNKVCFTKIVTENPLVGYTWRDSRGEKVSTKRDFEWIPKKIGSTTLTLTVENQRGFVASDTIDIITTVKKPSPTVAIEKDKIVKVNSTVTILGSGNTIQGELIEGYEFKLDGVVIKTSIGEMPIFTPTKLKKVNVTFKVPEIKDYKLELKIWDSMGQANYNVITVRAIKGEIPDIIYPLASAGPNLRATVNEPISISGSGTDLTIKDLHNTDWIMMYIDITFGSLFLNSNFNNNYFNPIMDLFEKYFLPVELDYVSDLTNRVKIRDKWNSVSMEHKIKVVVHAQFRSIQIPIRGLDHARCQVRLGGRHSIVDIKDHVQLRKYNPVPWRPSTDGITPAELW